MKRQVGAMLALVGLYPYLAFGQSDAANAADRIRQLNMGVVRVLALKTGNTVETGAGIMIGDHKGSMFFMTACHVIEDAADIEVEAYGARGNRARARVFNDRCDPVYDLAVLMVPSYTIDKGVQQLQEGRAAEARSGDRVLVLGHPPDKEWRLKETDIQASTKTHLRVPADLIQDGDSGGALLDTYGNLLGMVIGRTSDGAGQVLRADVAIRTFDAWGVPYRTRLHVNFCAHIQRIITSSEKNFDEMKGVSFKEDYSSDEQWKLIDRSLDITGEDGSKLVRRYREQTTEYIANFGSQGNEEKANALLFKLAEEVRACLPGNEKIFHKGPCLYSVWRQKWHQTPIHFVSYRRRYFSEVHLYMYRSYELPLVCRD